VSSAFWPVVKTPEPLTWGLARRALRQMARRVGCEGRPEHRARKSRRSRRSRIFDSAPARDGPFILEMPISYSEGVFLVFLATKKRIFQLPRTIGLNVDRGLLISISLKPYLAYRTIGL
jgi:hypothetical protein